MSASTNVAPVIIKRKKVVAGGGHHGGAWKVAYADFVTAMMAFFMLMWLLNATTEKQRKGLADYFSPTVPIHRVSGGSDGAFGGNNAFAEDVLPRDGSGATSVRPAEENRGRGATGVSDTGGDKSAVQDQFTAIEDALRGRSGESMASDDLLRHIVTRVTDEGLIIELFATDDVPLFNDGTDRPHQVLHDLLRMISSVTDLVTNDIAIGGHIRAHPVVLANNPVWDLSAARASRTRLLLERYGTDATRIQRVTGHADRKPVMRNPMSRRNNRIEITLLRN